MTFQGNRVFVEFCASGEGNESTNDPVCLLGQGPMHVGRISIHKDESNSASQDEDEHETEKEADKAPPTQPEHYVGRLEILGSGSFNDIPVRIKSIRKAPKPALVTHTMKRKSL